MWTYPSLEHQAIHIIILKDNLTVLFFTTCQLRDNYCFFSAMLPSTPTTANRKLLLGDYSSVPNHSLLTHSLLPAQYNVHSVVHSRVCSKLRLSHGLITDNYLSYATVFFHLWNREHYIVGLLAESSLPAIFVALWKLWVHYAVHWFTHSTFRQPLRNGNKQYRTLHSK